MHPPINAAKAARKAGPKLKDCADPQLTRTDAARDAGLSERQQKQAIRRMGEILKEVESGRGANLPNVGRDDGIQTGIAVFAREAGLTEALQKQAMRLERIPADRFRDLMSMNKLPTLAKLEEIGRGLVPARRRPFQFETVGRHHRRSGPDPQGPRC